MGRQAEVGNSIKKKEKRKKKGRCRKKDEPHDERLVKAVAPIASAPTQTKTNATLL